MRIFCTLSAVAVLILMVSGWADASQIDKATEHKQGVVSEILKSTKGAQNTPTWRADKKRLENLLSENITEEQDCQIRWDILWSWAKKGNLEARARLSVLTFAYWPVTPQIFPPGRSGDALSAMRDAAILSIHSSGVKFEDQQLQREYNSLAKTLYNGYLKNVSNGQSFLACLKEETAENCAHFASSYAGVPIKIKMIPTFEEYAAEIDAQAAQGLKPQCLYFRDLTPWGPERQQQFIKGK